MTNGLGRRIAIAAAAALTALTPALTAQAAAVDRIVTVTDGCGRVDSLRASAPGTYWLQAAPDGKAPAAYPPADTATPEEAAAAAKGYIRFDTSWQRTDDASTGYLLVRVLRWTGTTFEYLPLALAGSGVRGTDQITLTNADCVQPVAPTFTDQVGTDRDTVTIPSVTGVKYSPASGVVAGKGTMTVTATADKGYRLAGPDGTPLPLDRTRWTHTFDGTTPVSVPAAKAPTFRLGDVVPVSSSTPSGRGPNIVTVKHVPGVTWVVDGKAQKTSDKDLTLDVPVGTKTSVEVQAVSADPKAYVLTGTTEWLVGADPTTTPKTKPALPKVVADTEKLQSGASTITWAPAAGFPASARHNVRYRVITLTANNVRARAPWRAWLQETKVRKGILRAKPGSIVEIQVQSVSGTRVSPWSAVTTVWYPNDIAKAPGKTWKVIKQNGAIGGTMAITPQRTSAWTVKTPTTNRVMLWFGTSPAGAPATIYVDGRRVATVNTRDKHTKVRQVLKPIPVSWGKHVVTVVHTGTNGKTLRLDGVAFGR